MDSSKRMIAKAVTWQFTGFLVMTLVGYLFTGSFTSGGGIAIVGSTIGIVSYFLHEKIWSRFAWGRAALTA